MLPTKKLELIYASEDVDIYEAWNKDVCFTLYVYNGDRHSVAMVYDYKKEELVIEVELND